MSGRVVHGVKPGLINKAEEHESAEFFLGLLSPWGMERPENNLWT